MTPIDPLAGSAYQSDIALEWIDDELLFEAYKSGSEEAFDLLERRHSSGLRAFFSNILSGWVRPYVEDLSADTWLKVILRKNTFDSQKGKFKTWLYRIAYNVAIDWTRSNRGVWISCSDRTDYILNIYESLLRRDADQEIKAILRNALAKLPQEERTAIWLKHVEELTAGELAEVMGLPLCEAKNALRRGMLRLRAEFRTKEAA